MRARSAASACRIAVDNRSSRTCSVVDRRATRRACVTAPERSAGLTRPCAVGQPGFAQIQKEGWALDGAETGTHGGHVGRDKPGRSGYIWGYGGRDEGGAA